MHRDRLTTVSVTALSRISVVFLPPFSPKNAPSPPRETYFRFPELPSSMSSAPLPPPFPLLLPLPADALLVARGPARGRSCRARRRASDGPDRRRWTCLLWSAILRTVSYGRVKMTEIRLNQHDVPRFRQILAYFRKLIRDVVSLCLRHFCSAGGWHII